jgi:hypothetical protein
MVLALQAVEAGAPGFAPPLVELFEAFGKVRRYAGRPAGC